MALVQTSREYGLYFRDKLHCHFPPLRSALNQPLPQGFLRVYGPFQKQTLLFVCFFLFFFFLLLWRISLGGDFYFVLSFLFFSSFAISPFLSFLLYFLFFALCFSFLTLLYFLWTTCSFSLTLSSKEENRKHNFSFRNFLNFVKSPWRFNGSPASKPVSEIIFSY